MLYMFTDLILIFKYWHLLHSYWGRGHEQVYYNAGTPPESWHVGVAVQRSTSKKKSGETVIIQWLLESTCLGKSVVSYLGGIWQK